MPGQWPLVDVRSPLTASATGRASHAALRPAWGSIGPSSGTAQRGPRPPYPHRRLETWVRHAWPEAANLGTLSARPAPTGLAGRPRSIWPHGLRRGRRTSLLPPLDAPILDLDRGVLGPFPGSPGRGVSITSCRGVSRGLFARRAVDRLPQDVRVSVVPCILLNHVTKDPTQAR